MSRAALRVLLAAAGLAAAPATAQAALAPSEMEHSVLVTTYERSGQPTKSTRDERWVGSDRARMLTYDARGAVRAELVYAPEAMWSYRPGVGLFKWPATTRRGLDTLDEMASTSCGLQRAGTRRIGTDQRLGRAVNVTRMTVRSRRARAITTCWIDAANGVLLERRQDQRAARAGRKAPMRTVDTLRVEVAEVVPRDETTLVLSAHAASLPPVVPLPPFP